MRAHTRTHTHLNHLCALAPYTFLPHAPNNLFSSCPSKRGGDYQSYEKKKNRLLFLPLSPYLSVPPPSLITATKSPFVQHTQRPSSANLLPPLPFPLSFFPLLLRPLSPLFPLSTPSRSSIEHYPFLGCLSFLRPPQGTPSSRCMMRASWRSLMISTSSLRPRKRPMPRKC